MVNKQNILRFSLASFVLASMLGIYIALFTQPDERGVASAARATAVASILGVLGVSSFFVGLAYPKD